MLFFSYVTYSKGMFFFRRNCLPVTSGNHHLFIHYTFWYLIFFLSYEGFTLLMLSDRLTRSSRKNLWFLLSPKYVIVYGQAVKKYKLIVV